MASQAESESVGRNASAKPNRVSQDSVVIGASVALVVGAEVSFLIGGLVAGVVAGLVAVAVLLAVGSHARDHLRGRAAVALAVIPLLRVLSIAIPSLMAPSWQWYAQIGVPVLVATILAAVTIGITPYALGVRRAAPRPALVVAAVVGLGLGLIAYLLVRPESGAIQRGPATLLGASIAIVVGGALTEELLFRGLIQQMADEVTGGYGVLPSAALCTLVYLATLNLRYILLMALVAVGLGLVTRRYRSLFPAITCHGVLLWSQMILWPILLD